MTESTTANGAATPLAELAPSKRITAKAKTKAAGKRKATKAKKPSRSAAKGAGRREGQWVMSVHLPLALLKKLDAKVAALTKAGKRSSRSAFCVQALKSKL